MNTKSIGEHSQLMLMAALLRNGFPILMPYGDNQRYDLVIDTPEGFKRVQCKTGRFFKGAIHFAVASSSYHRGGKRRTYAGEIDLFAVYCEHNQSSYLVPITGLDLRNQCSLRLETPGNCQHAGIRWAHDFQLV